jgi:hypothetical protein
MWSALGRFYSYFWMHTEFWIATKVNRRPYTYIMRDWIYTHVKTFTIMAFVWFGCMYVLARYHAMLAVTISILTALLTAHLVWGSKWIPDEKG